MLQHCLVVDSHSIHYKCTVHCLICTEYRYYCRLYCIFTKIHVKIYVSTRTHAHHAQATSLNISIVTVEEHLLINSNAHLQMSNIAELSLPMFILCYLRCMVSWLVCCGCACCEWMASPSAAGHVKSIVGAKAICTMQFSRVCLIETPSSLPFLLMTEFYWYKLMDWEEYMLL